MIYADTSSFLKLLLREIHSAEVMEFVLGEDEVVVSEITELEAVVQLKAMRLGGLLKASVLKKTRVQMNEFFSLAPFRRVTVSGKLFAVALTQHEASGIHCRTLDRLHLAAMAEMGIKRLLTHDSRQADAARELGYQVVSPGL
jgi:predicted nucleic acid-binding protein